MKRGQWTKACDSSACVKVLDDGGDLVTLASTQSAGPAMSITRQEWEDFKAGVKAGVFDLD